MKISDESEQQQQPGATGDILGLGAALEGEAIPEAPATDLLVNEKKSGPAPGGGQKQKPKQKLLSETKLNPKMRLSLKGFKPPPGAEAAAAPAATGTTANDDLMSLAVGTPPPPQVRGGANAAAGGVGDLLLSFDTPPAAPPAAMAGAGVGVGVGAAGGAPQAWDQGFGLTTTTTTASAAAAEPAAASKSNDSAWASFEAAPQQSQAGTGGTAALALDPALFLANPAPVQNPMRAAAQPQMPQAASNEKDPFADLLK